MKVLKTAGPTKAEVFLVDVGEGPVVVKDFGRRSWWVRLIGRVQVSRECGAYRRVESLPGFPRLVGRIDAHALALEWIDGVQLSHAPRNQGKGAVWFGRLREIVERMHGAGLVHLDLRGSENVILAADERIYVIDLAAAIWFRPAGWPRRLFGGWLEMTDRAALLKWKGRLDAGPYSDDEEAFLRRFRFWRALWIFNPKRRRARGERKP